MKGDMAMNSCAIPGDTAGEVQYLRDADVDAALDGEIRGLLSTCFTKPGDEVFRERRYFHTPMHHRWLIRDAAGKMISHLAVRDTTIGTTAGELRIGLVGEVCVHPAWRGRKLVTRLLSAAHVWLGAEGFQFTLLCGNPAVYGGSGYGCVTNPFRYWDPTAQQWQTKEMARTMVKSLTSQIWPAGFVDMRGTF